MENKIKWYSHRSAFFESLKAQREQSKYTDATLAVDGRFYPVHKLVMSACSEYFNDIFENTPCKSPVIVLNDIRHNDIEVLLDYIYLGEVYVNQNDITSLLKTALNLRIKDLGVRDDHRSTIALSENSPGVHSDAHENSRPSKRRRRHVSSSIPQKVACSTPLPQNTTTTVINSTPKKSYPNTPNSENSDTDLINSADIPSILSYSTENIGNNKQGRLSETKIECDKEMRQGIGVLSKDIYNQDANTDGHLDKITDVDSDRVHEFDIIKIEHDVENNEDTCFLESTVQQEFNQYTDIATEGESSFVKVGLADVKEKDIEGICDKPMATEVSDSSVIEEIEELCNAAFSDGSSAQENVEMFKTNHGFQMPVYQGYKYRLDKKGNQQSRYRCVIRSCLAAITLYNEAPYRISFFTKQKHNHLPEREGELEAWKARMKMREMATQTFKDFNEIYTEVVSQISPSAMQVLKDKQSYIRNMRKLAAKANKLPRNSQICEDFMMRDEIKNTLDGEDWLIHEFLNEEGKEIVFSTMEMLTCLSHSDIHIMCEIYKVPSEFQKLFTIHVQTSNGRTFPAVFALLSKHDEETSRKLFHIINDKCEELGIPIPNPKTIMTGFDICVKNVISEIYPDSKINCNFSHFRKSTQQLLMDTGNSDLYRNDDFAKKFQMLNALAFLPLEGVITVFLELQELFVTEPEVSFISNFRQTFVRGDSQCSQQEKYHPALFPPEIWNLHQTVLNGDDPITINSIKSWQQNFQYCANKSKSSLFLYIDELKKEQKRAEKEILKVSAHRGHSRRDRPTSERIGKIREVLDDYGKLPNLDVLTALTDCIKMNFDI